MTAGKSTKSAIKGRKKLAVKKISEAVKWKPRTDIKKERETPASKPGIVFTRTASWLGSSALFKNDYIKEFRKKNPKDKSSVDAILRKATDAWRSLSKSDKAPYEARAVAAAIEYRNTVAKTASYRKIFF